MDGIAIKSSVIRYLVLLCTAAGLAAAGLFMVSQGQTALGWTGVVFFGSGVPLMFYKMLDARPQLLINDDGITDRRLRIGTIAWADIDSVSRKDIGGQAFLCLQLKDESKYFGNLSPMQQKVVDLNRKLGLPLFAIGLSQLRLDASQIEELVTKYLAVSRRAA